LSKQEPSGVKLHLKDPILNYTGKPVIDTSNIISLKEKNPELTDKELLEKCPAVTLGDQLASILMIVASDEEVKDAAEKLKLFRWASKISGKQETAKGELEIDLKQATELFDYVSKAKGVSIVVQAPILSILENIQKSLTKDDL